MGANESSNPIRNMDKRTARREYRDDFLRAILRLRQGYAVDFPADELDCSEEWESGDIRVFVRKRPIFKHEIDLGEFDVVTCASAKNVVIHDARMHTDMKRQFLNNHKFTFDRVFGEGSSNLEVYDVTTAPLVKFAIQGGYATTLVYGQTGSGKTFTMSSIYEQASFEIFVQLEALVADSPKLVQPTVSLSFFEIAGDVCHDLLNKFADAQLLSGVDGSFHAFPVVEPKVQSPEELMAMINHGRNVRATAATGVHDASSRSHAILRIYIHLDSDSGGSQDFQDRYEKFSEGTLTLVDLAGSEHRIDSMYHSADRRKEGAAINSSLMALKECIRARATRSNMTHQYRKSKLTMALKQSFVLPSARTVVIATVSPASKDTEHSLNTLRHACIMDGQEPSGGPEETRFVTGGSVETIQVGEVNLTLLGRKNLAAKRAGEDVGGGKTSNGNVMTAPTKDLTDVEKERMRRQLEKNSIASMKPEHRQILKLGRMSLSTNERQAIRLRKADGSVVKEDQLSGSISPVVCQATEQRAEPVLANIEVPSPKESRTPFRKLYAAVYTSGDSGTSESIRRRQLITLMRMNGYSEAEIESLAPPSPTEAKIEILKKKSVPARRAVADDSLPVRPAESFSVEDQPLPSRRSHVRQEEGGRIVRSASMKEPVAVVQEVEEEVEVVKSPPQNAVILEADRRRSRQEAARERRLKAEEEKRNALKAKITSKHGSGVVFSSPSEFQEVDRQSEISKLEHMLMTSDDLSAAAIFAINKQISNHKAAILREARAVKQPRDEPDFGYAEPYEPPVNSGGVRGHAYSEASQNADRPLSSRDQPRPDLAGRPKTPNSLGLKSSPRMSEHHSAAPPQHQQFVAQRRQQLFDPSFDQQPEAYDRGFQSRQEYAIGSNPGPSLSPRGQQQHQQRDSGPDYLDSRRQGGPVLGLKMLDKSNSRPTSQEIPVVRRGRGSHVGAASAPFANDYSWNSEN